MPDANDLQRLPAERYAQWDFANVDAAPDPRSFARYLRRRDDEQGAELRRQLSYALLEITAGQRLLDVGCGIGDDVRALARLVGESGEVIGLDNSERLLETARSRSEGAEFPGTFLHGDMHHMPFADATFDGCRAERVLIHSAQPAQVVEEMVRVTRAGGRVVVTEPDLDTLVFHATPRATVRTLTQWHSDRMRNGTAGRLLPEIFRECGLDNIHTYPTVAQSSQLTNYPRTLLARAQDAGIITADEGRAMLDDWERRAAHGTYLEYGVFFTVAGRKTS